MRDIDLKTLRLLVAVCDHRNMARAAEQEHIEPSAISKRIAQLEADLGTSLLVRARRGVEPTPAGLALLEHARTMLFTMDRIACDVSAFGTGIKGNIRLIATASAMSPRSCDSRSTPISGSTSRRGSRETWPDSCAKAVPASASAGRAST